MTWLVKLYVHLGITSYIIINLSLWSAKWGLWTCRRLWPCSKLHHT